jgi:hypothetical protein
MAVERVFRSCKCRPVFLSGVLLSAPRAGQIRSKTFRDRVLPAPAPSATDKGMIISNRHRFAFLHNPKAGGTSVRTLLDRYNDIGFGLWGVDTDQTGIRVDRAHLGLEEFARFYPDLWRDVQGYDLFSLSRDPLPRFFSSVAEHSKHHGRIDSRFATPAQRRAVLFRMIDRLEALGTAEAVLPDYELTHFRPQWIYWGFPDQPAEPSPGAAPRVEVWPLDRIDGFFARIEARVGEPLETAQANARETLALPGPLSGLASNRLVKRLARSLPGGDSVKALLRRRFAAGGPAAREGGLDMTPADQDAVAGFVRRFYARDIAAIARMQQDPPRKTPDAHPV